MFLECYPTGCQVYLLPRKLRCPLKRNYFNRKCIFQPLIFRGELLNFEGVSISILYKWSHMAGNFGSLNARWKWSQQVNSRFFSHRLLWPEEDESEGCREMKRRIHMPYNYLLYVYILYIYFLIYTLYYTWRWWFQLEAALPGEMIQFD